MTAVLLIAVARPRRTHGHRQAMKLFEMIKKGDLEGLVVNRKDGKYSQRTLWYKILNPAYTQKAGRQEFFQRQ